MKTTQVQLVNTPKSLPVESDFRLSEITLPELAQGEVLCETHYLSLDPYMRSQMAGLHTSGSVLPGEGLKGETVSRVLQSRTSSYSAGDLVRAPAGWQAHSVHSGDAVSALPKYNVPASYYLSVLGMPGLTAYAGLVCLADIQAGDTVLIPAAIGGVGGVAAQLARRAGCRVIGIAGGAAKCEVAIEELGYEACIDRLTDDVPGMLDKLCPEGIDVFFDLVGGPLLHHVSERLCIDARVVLCGLMAEYNSPTRMAGPPPGLWIKARATVHGLVVYDFESKREEFTATIAPLIESSAMVAVEDRVDGLSCAPKLFCRLMRGENQGKAIVVVKPT